MSEKKVLSMNEHFLRQRRNVFISGLILLLLIFFNSEDSQYIQNTLVQWIEIPTHIAIVLILWLFYYFCLRYIQHILDDDILRKIYEVYLREYPFKKDKDSRININGKKYFVSTSYIAYKSSSWGDYSLSFDDINRKILKNQSDRSDADKNVFTHIYRITSFKHMFFKDIKTFVASLSNRKYGDYLFPLIFIFTVWIVILFKIFPILIYLIK